VNTFPHQRTVSDLNKPAVAAGPTSTVDPRRSGGVDHR